MDPRRLVRPVRPPDYKYSSEVSKEKVFKFFHEIERHAPSIRFLEAFAMLVESDMRAQADASTQMFDRESANSSQGKAAKAAFEKIHFSRHGWSLVCNRSHYVRVRIMRPPTPDRPALLYLVCRCLEETYQKHLPRELVVDARRKGVIAAIRSFFSEHGKTEAEIDFLENDTGEPLGREDLYVEYTGESPWIKPDAWHPEVEEKRRAEERRLPPVPLFHSPVVHVTTPAPAHPVLRGSSWNPFRSGGGGGDEERPHDLRHGPVVIIPTPGNPNAQ